MKVLLYILLLLYLPVCSLAQESAWETIESDGEIIARHENAFVKQDGRFYLLGGRRVQPISVYDSKTNTWDTATAPPIEMHHFQAVSHNKLIYVIGAQTGKYPYEPPVEHIYTYSPTKDQWRKGAVIPQDVQRGAAGVVVYKGKFYMLCGIVNGHYGGHSKRFDCYDPKTDRWTQLPDAPRVRDHFHAVVLNDKLYAIGGRISSKKTGHVFDLTIPEVDIYDFKTGQWSSPDCDLPTMRAGCTTVAYKNYIIVLGGESHQQQDAHSQVQALNTKTMTWTDLPALNQGRHGTQAFIYKKWLYIASGCGQRGGRPELSSMERLLLRKLIVKN